MIRVLALLALLLVAAATVRGSGATFTARTVNPGSSFSTASDWTGPAVTITAPANGSSTNDTTPTVSGAAGNATGDAATVTLRVYSGTAATGAPLRTLALTRSGATWSTTLAALATGTYTVQATQTDSAGNTGTSAANTFTIDTTKPVGTSISSTNKAGGTAGRLEPGDALTYTYSEAIAPASILAGFTGASTPVRVRFTDNAGSDEVTVYNSAGTTQTRLGTVDTNANYVTGTVWFTNSTMVVSADGTSVTVTLGTPDRTDRIRTTAAAGANMTWTWATGVADLAGNAITSTGAWSETAGDQDF